MLIPNSTRAAPLIEVRFVPLSGVTLEQLAQGMPGRGLLLYYPSGGTPKRPALVVLLEKVTGAEVSTAKIYDDQSGNGYVDISLQGDVLTVLEPHGPGIIMTALGGWWVRDGIANYNLDVQIFGQVCAMWGAGPDCGGGGYINYLKPGELNFDIHVRDPEHLGIPQWELRSLVPAFPGLGYVRTHYAERKCASPVKPVPSPSPEWPYVAHRQGFLQDPGAFQPPIGVDWDKSRITLFAELVAVRGQNCSYNLYSITPVKLGALNSPDFEAPFAFYDLSGKGQGQPNLIIRMGRFYAQDPWFAPELFARRPDYKPPVVTIRYSWRNDVGNGSFDYKVDMFGFHPYTDKTPIAGGSAWIDAPPYAKLPSWVIGKPWPSTTFIDTNGGSYSTSEGIYEWSSDYIGWAYLLGISDTPDLSRWEEIPLGFRGEFRYQRADQPHLYLSPLDNRLHLLYAEGGIWNLGDGWLLREHNLTGGPYIDGWTLERVPTESGAELEDTSAQVVQAFYALEDHILFADATDYSVILKETQYAPSLFTLLPPTDHASWEDFRTRLQPYRGHGRDPKDLRAWLADFAGPSLEISKGSIRGVRPDGDGFRFVLDLQPGFQVSGANSPDLTGLRPGAYVVTYQDGFTVQPLTPAQPEIVPNTLRLSNPAPAKLEPVKVEAFIYNAGLEDLLSLQVSAHAVGPGQRSQVITKTIALLAGQTVPVRFDWTPPIPGEWQVTLTWGDEDGQSTPDSASGSATLNVLVGTPPPLDVATVWRLSNVSQPLALAVFIACLGLTAAILTLVTLRSIGSWL